jgi:hypothetical protein
VITRESITRALLKSLLKKEEIEKREFFLPDGTKFLQIEGEPELIDQFIANIGPEVSVCIPNVRSEDIYADASLTAERRLATMIQEEAMLTPTELMAMIRDVLEKYGPTLDYYPATDLPNELIELGHNLAVVCIESDLCHAALEYDVRPGERFWYLWLHRGVESCISIYRHYRFFYPGTDQKVLSGGQKK